MPASTASLVKGTYVEPSRARMTVGEWCDVWMSGYGTRRRGTVRQAQVHLKVIRETFENWRLSAVKPSDVKARHYFASLLIGAGLDIKTVQTRLRHASATTTLNVYGHMFPDKDESARAAVAVAFAARADCLRTEETLTLS